MATTAESTGSSGTAGPAWARGLQRINNYLLFDLVGGPRPLRLAWVIDLQKGGCFVFFGFLMWWYADATPQATSAPAWVYLALHGSYGLVWLAKDIAFPDRNWQGRCTLPSAVFGLFGLGLYWAIGWLGRVYNYRGVALLPKIVPGKARGAGPSTPRAKPRNAAWRDFERNPSGRSHFSAILRCRSLM